MDRPVSTVIFVSAALALTLLFYTGCTLDFDEFESPGPDATTGEDAGFDADDVLPPDADHNDTPIPDPGEIGSACDEDSDCNDDTCRAGVCLAPCSSDEDCPEQTACYQLGTEHLCAPRCLSTKRCDHIQVHDDLKCVYVVETRPLGSSPHSLRRACLPDSADDGVFDGVDNCPDTQNAPQVDSTGDGVGDACSPTPYCHVDSSSGLLTYDTVDYPVADFVIPPVVDGRWLPIVGIGGSVVEDENSGYRSHTLLLDRQTGEWHDKGLLEFSGAHRNITATNTGGFLISPGIRGDEPEGAWAQISPHGEISYGPPFQSYHSASTIPSGAAPMQFPNGETLHLRVRESVTSFSHFLYFDVMAFGDDYRFTQFLNVDIFSSSLENDPLTYSDFRDPPQTLRHPDGTVGVALWHPEESSIYLVDITAPRGAPYRSEALHILELSEETGEDDGDPDDGDPDNGDPDDGDPDNGDPDNGDPDVEDLSDFDPLLLPAPGGQIYVFDRNSGRAGRFVAQRHEDADSSQSALFQRTWSDFERLPEYDLGVFDDFDDFSVYLLPDATGLGIVGRPAGDESGTLRVRELYFHCLPLTDNLDTSGDGVGDLIDNCPFEENPDQADLDDDAWGDACDPDIDGDGIPNALDHLVIDDDNGEPDNGDNGEPDNGDNGEPDNGDNGDNGDENIIDLSRDSNNNGIPNLDDDDTDGDGIPDQYDPFPLDSSNDGTPNLWTNDASGNSYTDDTLRQHELDPYYFFSLPAYPYFLYLTDDGDGGRTLYRTSLADRSDATSFDLPDDVAPHQISFGPSDDSIVYLTDVPGQTNRFQAYDLEQQELIFEVELNPDQNPLPAIRSVTMVDADTAIIVHEKPGRDEWFVSTIQPGEVGYVRHGLDAINELFDYFWYAHQHRGENGNVTFLLAAESDCRECALPYVYHHDSDALYLVDGGLLGIELVSAQGDLVAYTSGEGDDRTIHYLRMDATQSFASADISSAVGDVSSVAFSQPRDTDGQAIDSATPFTLVTTSHYGQPLSVWLQVPGINDPHRRWRQLLALDAPIAEVIWFP